MQAVDVDFRRCRLRPLELAETVHERAQRIRWEMDDRRRRCHSKIVSLQKAYLGICERRRQRTRPIRPVERLGDPDPDPDPEPHPDPDLDPEHHPPGQDQEGREPDTPRREKKLHVFTREDCIRTSDPYRRYIRAIFTRMWYESATQPLLYERCLTPQDMPVSLRDYNPQTVVRERPNTNSYGIRSIDVTYVARLFTQLYLSIKPRRHHAHRRFSSALQQRALLPRIAPRRVHTAPGRSSSRRAGGQRKAASEDSSRSRSPASVAAARDRQRRTEARGSSVATARERQRTDARESSVGTTRERQRRSATRGSPVGVARERQRTEARFSPVGAGKRKRGSADKAKDGYKPKAEGAGRRIPPRRPDSPLKLKSTKEQRGRGGKSAKGKDESKGKLRSIAESNERPVFSGQGKRRSKEERSAGKREARERPVRSGRDQTEFRGKREPKERVRSSDRSKANSEMKGKDTHERREQSSDRNKRKNVLKEKQRDNAQPREKSGDRGKGLRGKHKDQTDPKDQASDHGKGKIDMKGKQTGKPEQNGDSTDRGKGKTGLKGKQVSKTEPKDQSVGREKGKREVKGKQKGKGEPREKSADSGKGKRTNKPEPKDRLSTGGKGRNELGGKRTDGPEPGKQDQKEKASIRGKGRNEPLTPEKGETKKPSATMARKEPGSKSELQPKKQTALAAASASPKPKGGALSPVSTTQASDDTDREPVSDVMQASVSLGTTTSTPYQPTAGVQGPAVATAREVGVVSGQISPGIQTEVTTVVKQDTRASMRDASPDARVEIQAGCKAIIKMFNERARSASITRQSSLFKSPEGGPWPLPAIQPPLSGPVQDRTVAPISGTGPSHLAGTPTSEKTEDACLLPFIAIGPAVAETSYSATRVSSKTVIDEQKAHNNVRVATAAEHHIGIPPIVIDSTVAESSYSATRVSSKMVIDEQKIHDTVRVATTAEHHTYMQKTSSATNVHNGLGISSSGASVISESVVAETSYSATRLSSKTVIDEQKAHDCVCVETTAEHHIGIPPIVIDSTVDESSYSATRVSSNTVIDEQKSRDTVRVATTAEHHTTTAEHRTYTQKTSSATNVHNGLGISSSGASVISESDETSFRSLAMSFSHRASPLATKESTESDTDSMDNVVVIEYSRSNRIQLTQGQSQTAESSMQKSWSSIESKGSESDDDAAKMDARDDQHPAGPSPAKRAGKRENVVGGAKGGFVKQFVGIRVTKDTAVEWRTDSLRNATFTLDSSLSVEVKDSDRRQGKSGQKGRKEDEA